MPIIRYCEVSGCSKKLPPNRHKCDEHRAPARPKYIKYDWQLWYQRGDWKKLSRQIREAEPFCRICKTAGRITRSTQVDHIIPHEGNEDLFWDRKNLQPICSECHGEKTAAERAERERRESSNV